MYAHKLTASNNNIQRNQVNTVHRATSVSFDKGEQLELHHSQQVMSEERHHILHFKHKLARRWSGWSSARSSDNQASADPLSGVLA